MKIYWHRKKFLDPAHPVAKAYAMPKIDYIKKFIDIQPSFRILDVGAGTGVMMYYLNQIADTIGIDTCGYLIDKNPLKNKMQHGDIYHAPFKNEEFDIVIASNLLHHLDDPDLALGEMARLSRKYLVLIEPNCINPPSFVYHAVVREERRALRYNPDMLRRLLDERRLKVLSCIATGMVYQNMTPEFLLPALKIFDRPFSMGAYSLAIAEKMEN